MTYFTGSTGNDTFNGATGVLNGFTGGTAAEATDNVGDTIDGGVGNDTITGGPGQDTIHGGDGNDVLDGGRSNGGGAYTQYIYGDAGNDTLSSLDWAYAYLYGGDGNDTIYGDIYSGLIEGGAGADTLYGGSGRFTASLSYIGSNAAVIIDLGRDKATGGHAGGDKIIGFSHVIGSDWGDTLRGDAGINYLTGGDGNDRLFGLGDEDGLYGGDGDDVLDGGAGDDALHPGTGVNVVKGGKGFDRIDFSDLSSGVVVDLRSQTLGGAAAGSRMSGIEEARGSRGDDRITGTKSANDMDGYEGNDALYGLGGADTFTTGYGNCRVFGGAGDDTFLLSGKVEGASSKLDGGAGTDRLSIYSGEIELNLGMGTGHWLSSSYSFGVNVYLELKSIEVFSLGFGNDTVRGSRAGDTVDGGSGDDMINGLGGNDSFDGGSGNDTLIGGRGRDILDGGSGDDILHGNAGADDLFGDDGDDTLSGGSGNDTLRGDSGAEHMDGGKGVDTVVYDYISIATSINLGTGVGSGDSAVEGDTYVSVENIRIVGASASITLTGNAADNSLNGGRAADRIFGGGGSDTIAGGGGNDTLTGGSGRDTFVFGDTGSEDADTITDFNAAETIALEASAFAAIGDKLGAGQFVLGSAAKDGNDRILYDAARGKLFYDADGKGGEGRELIADIGTGLAIDHTNFVLI